MANLPELRSPGSNVNGSQMFSFYKKKLNVFISFHGTSQRAVRGAIGNLWVAVAWLNNLFEKNYVAMQKYPPPSTTSLPVLTARKSFTSIQNWEGNLGNPEQRNVHSLWSTRDFSCHRPKASLIFLHIQRIQGPACCPAQCQGIMMHTQVRVSNWS